MKNAVLVLLGTILIVLSAQLSITPAEGAVPITGQSLGVLLVAFALPRFLGLLSILIYLLSGAMGLPVFAEGAAGIEHFTGGGGGYLWGFSVAGIVVAYLRHIGYACSVFHAWVAMFIGTMVLLLCGMGQLAVVLHDQSWTKALSQAYQYGVAPYWFGAWIKIALGGALAYGLAQKLTSDEN